VDVEQGQAHATAGNSPGSVRSETSSEITHFEFEHAETSRARRAKAVMYGVDRPFFHIDLVDAVDAAVRDARARDASPQHATASE
jgi:hypothetical protein